MGHLNGLFAPRGGNLNKPIFKSSNARGGCPGGVLNFRIDRRVNLTLQAQINAMASVLELISRCFGAGEAFYLVQ